ncbi:MAG: tetratricopeptide repeat protein [Firmicutes bacterium]|nr:tetratricopeptide repeat protein [Bacillota bacterium]
MDDRINLNEFYQGLDIMFQRKDKTQTINYLESWLREAERISDTSGIVAVSNELGGICRAIGQVDRAKALYVRVLQLLEEMGLKETPHYATALLNTGDVYVNSRELDVALDYFLKAKALLEQCGLEGDYRMAALCNNISMVYRDIGLPDKAEEALNISFNIIKGIPECIGDLATTYINLGELQIKQDKLEMAQESFEKAIEIYEKTGGTDVHYPYACSGIGQVHYLKGNKYQAISWYQKALELIERDFGKTDYYRLIERNLEKVREM